MAPSLVTCPTISVGHALVLGEAHEPRRARAHLADAARRPARSGSNTVWIESTTSTPGALDKRGRLDGRDVELGQQRRCRLPPQPGDARSPTCCGDSSPHT